MSCRSSGALRLLNRPFTQFSYRRAGLLVITKNRLEVEGNNGDLQQVAVARFEDLQQTAPPSRWIARPHPWFVLGTLGVNATSSLPSQNHFTYVHLH